MTDADLRAENERLRRVVLAAASWPCEYDGCEPDDECLTCAAKSALAACDPKEHQ